MLDAINVGLAAVDRAAEGMWRARKIPIVVLLDIHNTFRSMPWESILNALSEGASVCT